MNPLSQIFLQHDLISQILCIIKTKTKILPTGLPGVPGIVKDGRDGSPGDPGEPGEAGRVGRTGHQGPPGICDTSACQGASVAGKSSNPKNH